MLANRRLAIEAAEADVDVPGGMTHWTGAKLAFQDPKTYLLAFMYHCIVGGTGFQNFFPTLTATLGYSDTVSLLLVAPPYIFAVFYTFGHAMLSDRMQNRFWFYLYPLPISIVGCLVFMFTDGFGPRYFSLFLLNFAFASFGTVSIRFLRRDTSPLTVRLAIRLDLQLHPPPSSQTHRRSRLHE